jgi:hypothetical protein
MKKLLLMLGLIAIAYPLEVSARDLVEVAESSEGATFYVWRDSIRKNRNIVWWREETVLYGTDGRLEDHFIADKSGDCVNMASRVQKLYNQISGEKYLKPQNLISHAPRSVGYSLLEYVCSSK